MFLKKLLLPLFLLITQKTIAQINTSFQCPDTICINEIVNIKNSSSNNSNQIWTFCNENLVYQKSTKIVDPQINYVTYTFPVEENGLKYMFVVGHSPYRLYRYDFGNSYFNKPIIVQLNTNGLITEYGEGISIYKQNGIWYGLTVSGSIFSERALYRLNFGSNIESIPIIENLGKSFFIDSPHDLKIVKDGNEIICIISNFNNDNLTIISFGTDIQSSPKTVQNIKSNNLIYPTNLKVIKDEILGRVVLASNSNDNSIAVIKFGSSFKNNPIVTKLSLGNIDCKFYAMNALKTCDGYKVYVIGNHNSNFSINGNIYQINIDKAFDKISTINLLDNIKNSSLPHSLNIVTENNKILLFEFETFNNFYNILEFSNCNNPDIANSYIYNPPSFSYSTTGNHQISLLTNIGLPDQNAFCKTIYVKDSIKKPMIVGETNYCIGDDLKLKTNGKYNIKWSGPNNFVSSENSIELKNITKKNQGFYHYNIEGSADKCGKYNDSIYIEINSRGFSKVDTFICKGNTYQSPKGNIGISGIVSDTFGLFPCDSIVYYNIKYYKLLNTNFGRYKKLSFGDSLKLICNFYEDSIKVKKIIIESPNDTVNYENCHDIYLHLFKDTKFTIKTIDFHDCITKDSIYIFVKKDKKIFAPNIFSANGDGFNDNFLVFGDYTLKSIKKLSIFNRWGDLVFENYNIEPNDVLNGWDGTFNGKKLNEATFAWMAELEFIDGSIEVFKGDVTLIH